MRNCDIARRLGTSPEYVRVVLQRNGGQSQYDRAHKAKDKTRARRAEARRQVYNAVSPSERKAIRAAYFAAARAAGRMQTRADRNKVSGEAYREVLKRGRALLLAAGHGTQPQAESIAGGQGR